MLQLQSPAQRAKLSILDLLLLTASLAVALAIHSAIYRATYSGEAPVPSAFVFLESANCGVFFFLLLKLRSIKKQFGKFLIEPGHWLIAYLGVSSGIERIIWYFAIVLVDSQDPESSMYWFFASQLIYGITAWLLAIFSAIQHAGYWRLFFVSLLIPGTLIQFLQMWFLGPTQLYYVYVGLPLLQGLVLLIPTASDLCRSEKRNGLHWVGIGLGVTNLLGLPIFGVFWWLSQ